MERMDFVGSLHPDSPVQRYLKWINESGNDELYLKRYKALASEQEKEKRCFLTVIIRTQGSGQEKLQDVFTCLQAQQDNDFEVVLICCGTEEEYRLTEELVSRQAPAFVSGVRILRAKADEPGSAANLGFASARGEYAVCLNEDDLVLDHWVKVFHDAAAAQSRMILHACVVTQPWNAESSTGSRRQRITAAETADGRNCVPYHTFRQPAESECISAGVAYPLFLFRDMHILFSEETEAGADRDYLLRTAGIAGIYDIREITAIHRQWNIPKPAGQFVPEPEWMHPAQENGGKDKDIPLLLTECEAECLLSDLQSAEQWGRSCFLREAALFWSDEKPFSDKRYMKTSVSMKDGWIRAVFSLERQCREETVTRLRFDPSEEPLFTLEQINAGLYQGDRLLRSLTLADVQETNGLVDGDSVFFLKEDPMLVFESKEPIPPCTAVVTARVTYHSPAFLRRLTEELSADACWRKANRSTAHLYPDRGKGFLPEDNLACSGVIAEERYLAEFSFSSDEGKGIRELRFDPTEEEMFRLDELRIDIVYTDETRDTLGAGQVTLLNGFETGNGLAFIERDPYMMIPVNEAKALKKVTITGKAGFIGNQEMEECFARAVRVPDYELICGQLSRMRLNRKGGFQTA